MLVLLRITLGTPFVTKTRSNLGIVALVALKWLFSTFGKRELASAKSPVENYLIIFISLIYKTEICEIVYYKSGVSLRTVILT